uniref:Reverse transcriptase zinc-binding domain-containing protein n=1 Tax=Fagus sylvatica TaxID=28930 RepID=A0A2N9HT93_FAGSY
MGEEFKYHLVSQDRVCEPLCYGGSGMKNLVLFNQALLGKWLWWYATKKEALWRKIVELKYGVFRKASVKDLARFDSTSFHWNVSFTCLVQDWELESVADFMDVIYSVTPNQGAIDTICWKVLSLEECVEDTCSLKGPFLHMDNISGKVLKIDYLRKRQLVLLDWCCMCKEDGESIDHLFLHCNVANELWKLVFSMFGIWWVMPCHVMDLLACWSGYTRRNRFAAIWGVIPHCIMWVIWRERNARSFEDIEHSPQELKQQFLNV